MVCIVCRRDKNVKRRALPSGAVAPMCEQCVNNAYTIAEAEKRAATQGGAR